MGRGAPDRPSTPGWYPDPWSADGIGERYWDGKRWRGSDRADHPTVAKPEKRRRASRTDRASAAPGSSRRRTVVGIVVLLVVATGMVWLQRRDQNTNSSASSASASIATDAPPPGAGSGSNPIGRPAAVPPGTGEFEFLATQPGDSDAPVAWDPCRTVQYVVNPDGAPPDGDALIADAVDTVSRATGLRFANVGRTSERPRRDRDPFQPRRYGDQRWAPVLIAWSREDEYPELSGYIAGVAGPQRVQRGNAPAVYVTGQVVLDAEQLSMTDVPDRTDARAVVLHELGHLAGLAHTADDGQLMYSEATRNVRDYQVGDLLGLAELGSQKCVPEV